MTVPLYLADLARLISHVSEEFQERDIGENSVRYSPQTALPPHIHPQHATRSFLAFSAGNDQIDK